MSRYERLSVSDLVIPLSDSANKSSMVSVSLTPASVAAATAAYQTLTVPGVQVGDQIIGITDPITNAVALTGARVTAANTVAVQFLNPTAGALVPTAGAYVFLVLATA